MNRNLILFALFIVIGCSNSPFSTSSLPEKWTPTTSVHYYHGGGMANESEQIDIYTDSAVYIIHMDEITNRHQLKLSKENLNAIAKIFHENKFDCINEAETGLVHDKASTTLQICINGKCISKGDGATNSVIESHWDRFNRVKNYILKIAGEKKSSNDLPIKVEIDQSLLDDEVGFGYQIDPAGIVYSYENDGMSKTQEYEFSPGKYYLMAYTYRKGPNGNTRYEKEFSLQFNPQDCNAILFKLKDTLLIGETISRLK